MNTALLNHFRSNVSFRSLLSEIREERYPIVKQWQPQLTHEENVRLLEEIKFASAQQQGFDLLYRLLTGE